MRVPLHPDFKGGIVVIPNATQRLSKKQIQDAIDLRRSKIDRLLREIAYFQGCNNTLSPIFRLPSEVLGQIFVCLMSSYDLRDIWEGLYDGETTNTHEWLVICQVCKYWRDVALGCAQLWTRIVFTQTEDRVNAFLERSGNTTMLSFEPRQRNKLSYEHAKMVFSRYASRTKSIHGLSLGHTFAKRLARAEVPETLSLESLDIEVTTDRLEAFAPLSHADMPRLKMLRCARASGLLMQSLLRPTLTELAVEDISTLPDASQWAAILQNLGSLTRLKLYGAVFSQTNSDVRNRSQVRLEHLRSLHLSDVDAGHGCAALLDQLVYPSAISLRFYTKSFALTSDPLPVLRILGQHISGANAIGSPRTFDYMSLDDTSERGLAFVIGQGDGTLQISLPYHIDAQDTWLRHITQYFPVPQVTRLTLRSFRDVEVDAWIDSSPAFPNVTSLTLGGGIPNLHVLSALEEIAFLPNLSDIVLSGCYTDPQWLRRLSSALSQRKLRGLVLATVYIGYETLGEELRNLRNVAGQVYVHSL